MDAMVEQGRLTREQADAYIQWYQARPEGVPGFRGFGFWEGFGGHGRGLEHGFKGWGERHRFIPAPSQEAPAPAGAVLQ
jgi:hypothetical protein